MAFTNPKRMYDNETGQSGGEDGLALRGGILYASPGKTISAARQVLQSKNVVDDNDNDLGYTASYYSDHPEEPGMQLILYSAIGRIRIAGVEGWLIEAQYAIPSLGPFTEPPEDTTSPEYYKFSIDFGEVQIPYPIIRKHKIAHAVADPVPGVVLTDDWRREEGTLEVETITASITFNIKAENFTPAIYAAVRAQVGKLHKFGGGGLGQSADLWRFRRPSIGNVAKGVVQFKYTWLSDPGNKGIEGILQDGTTYDDPEVGPPGPPPADAATLIVPSRKPFQEYAVIANAPSKDSPSAPPTIVAAGPFRAIEPNGHLALPLIDANSPFPL